MNNESKIFISHSSKDYKVVEQVINIIEAIGVPSRKIFCSSFEGYSIGLGENFLETIKTELNNNALVIFVLSENFYSSPICLCEMGASWVKTNSHVPILIPPFGYGDVKGVIPNSQGMKINEKNKLNSLKEKVERFMELESQSQSAWERKRDNILENLETALSEVSINENELVVDHNIEDSPDIELGLMDYIDQYVDLLAESTKSLNNIADSTTWIGSEITEKTEELVRINKLPNPNPNVRRSLFERMARSMKDFTKEIGDESPFFLLKFEEAMSVCMEMLEIINDFNNEETIDELVTMKDGIFDLKLAIHGCITSTEGFQNEVDIMPRIEKTMNSAKQRMSFELKMLIDRMKTALGLSDLLSKKMNEKIDEMKMSMSKT